MKDSAGGMVDVQSTTNESTVLAVTGATTSLDGRDVVIDRDAVTGGEVSSLELHGRIIGGWALRPRRTLALLSHAAGTAFDVFGSRANGGGMLCR